MSNVKNFKDLVETKEDHKIVEVPKGALEEVQDEVILEAMDNTLSDLAPTTLERGILESSLKGLSISTTAFNLGIPESHVRTYLRKPKVKAHIKELKEAINEIDQMMITNTLRKIVADRIDNLGEDESFADLTNKDTLDVIKTFSDLTNQIAKGQTVESDDNIFVNIYNQILTKD